MSAKILYVNTFPDYRVEGMTLSGIRRYAAAHGWRVETADTAEVAPGNLSALLRALRPAGCIVECFGGDAPIPAARFKGIPVVFCNCTRHRHGTRVARVSVDDAAVAKAAFRELSAWCPKAYAVVASRQRRVWTALRMAAFRAEVAATARLTCLVFGGAGTPDAPPDLRARRLAAWVASLPCGCAIFAVNDETAAEVAAAARATYRPIPRELTLLGVDNDPAICESSHPTVSSVQLDFERMGYLAAKMLGGMMASAKRGMTAFADAAKDAPFMARNDDRASGAVIGPLLAVRRESTGGYGRREPHVLEAVEIIRREACEGLSVAELAGRLPGSRRLLDLRFREAMGHSIHEEILQVRLERVFDLLRRLDVRIGAVADFSGFSLHQLDKVFRIRFGCSLREWRRRNVQP